MSSIADLVVPSSDARRKAAARFARHLPADAAAAAVALTLPQRGDRGPIDVDVENHPCGMPALLRTRVLVPLVEPNVLSWGRMITRPGAPHPTMTEDRIITASWNSPAEHATAAGAVVREYEQRHSGTEDIAEFVSHSRLDSWHEPLALVPVRHTYQDGSASVLRWMAADGTARIVGARLAFARAFAPWLTDHPYADPYADWPTGTVVLRRFLAAARIEADRQAAARRAEDPDLNQVNPSWFLTSPGIEDFASLIMPTAEANGQDGAKVDMVHKVGMWNFLTHTGGTRPDPDAFSDEVRNYLESLDVWSGKDPFDILGTDPADADGRDQVTYAEEQVTEWLATAGGPEDVKAQRIAAFMVAVSDPATAPSGDATTLLTDYAITILGNNGFARMVGTDLGAVREDLVATLGAPRLGDLYGVWGDLTSGDVNTPLRNPNNHWFWLGAAQGLTYAAVLGHLTGTGADGLVQRLTGTSDGRDQVLAYADACAEGLGRVPLVTGPDGTWANAHTLAAWLTPAAAHLEG